jgi:hypothetical protein
MEAKQAKNGVASLRAHMRGDVRFRFELLAAISSVARDHGIDLSGEALGNLVLVDASEIDKTLRGPDLPGGTNC